MLNIYQNITKIFILQNAIGAILDRIGSEIDSHAVCIIANSPLENCCNEDVQQQKLAIIHSFNLREIPTISADCQIFVNDSTNFINHMQQGVRSGCSFFVVSVECALPFMENFRVIHDWVDEKYEKKVFAIVDSDQILSHDRILDTLTHETVVNFLPLTLLIQPNINEWIDIWSAYPFASYDQIYNRFFPNNFTFQHDKQIIPDLLDLNGLSVVGALMHYPPYTAYYHVPPGTGNAKLYNSNESLSVRLDGLEHLILVELCLKYNCTLTARLDYDEELWGDIYDNQTGSGLLGALAMYQADVTCSSLTLWHSTYKFTQYSAQLQRAIVTNIVPKPLPLAYWKTPMLPFPVYIWCYVIGSLLTCAIVLFIINFVQIKMKMEKHSSIEEVGHKKYGFFDSIFAVFMMSIFQTVEINTKYFSNVTIFLVIIVYALVIGNLYIGGLSSVMTLTRYDEPIDNLDKLLESNIIWGSTSLAWIYYIEESEYPQHQKFIEKFVVKSVPEILELTEHRHMAVMLEFMQSGTMCFQPYIDRETSKNYMEMMEPLYWVATIMMTSKTWPYMEQLNRIILMQQESGIRYYLERGSGLRTMDYVIQRNIDENEKPPEQNDPKTLSVEHVLGAIFLLVVGDICATVVFFGEVFFGCCKKKKGNLQFSKLKGHKNI